MVVDIMEVLLELYFCGHSVVFFFQISQHRQVLFYSFYEDLQHARIVTFCLFCGQELIILSWEARVFDGNMLKSSPASSQAKMCL
jgi:hypothetical protein